MFRMLMMITVGLALAGCRNGINGQPTRVLGEAGEPVTPSVKQPAAGHADATPAPDGKMKELVWSGATIRLGMTKTEVLAEIDKSPKGHWYAIDLDAPPYGELHKMDSWVLSYFNPSDPDQGGGVVTMSFTNERLAEMNEGNTQ